MIYGYRVLILTKIVAFGEAFQREAVTSEAGYLGGIQQHRHEGVLYESAPSLARRTQRLTNHHHRY